jgi:nitrogen fixation/metabolism regulation signal transduction histidine kinase
MTPTGYAFVFLTAIVAGLIAILVFAMLRFAAAARDARRHLRDRDTERVFVSTAMQQALETLKAQEKAMSARARASEQLSEQIVAGLTAGLLVVAHDGTVQILNPAGRRLLGAGDGDLRGSYRELLGGAPPLAAVIDECLSTGRAILRRALRLELPDGTMHLGVTVSPLGAAGTEAQGAICLFSDLTAVVELEEQLRLKATLARLGELTAGMAHEFRNGLATIHGYGRLLDPQHLPEQYRPYVEGIRQETDALRQVVTNFLNFAKPEQVSFHPVDLREVVQRASEDVLPADGSRGRLEIRGRFGTVPGDEVMLRQAFSNLLRNAVEACEGAGTTPRLVVTAAVDVAQAHATVTVEDNGPGIDAALADRVFHPFFTTKPQGTGLGLALVQKIVVTHNGRVTVGRAAGGGASIQVMLPSAAADPVAVT